MKKTFCQDRLGTRAGKALTPKTFVCVQVNRLSPHRTPAISLKDTVIREEITDHVSSSRSHIT